jgi:hypothetical protein
MTNADENLQQAIESGRNVPLESDDAKAYQYIFEALKKSDDFVLPEAFADRVMLKIKPKGSSFLKEYIWLGLGLLTMIIGLIATAMYLKIDWSLGFLEKMSEYKGLLLVGGILIVVFNVLEKHLLRHKSL